MRLFHWLQLPGREVSSVLARQGTRSPLIVSAIGMTMGCFLILFTIQVVQDLSRLLNKEFGSTVGEYLVISRKASLLGTLARVDQRFTPEEVEEIRKQPFVSEVGTVTMSRFRARLTGTESIPFVTELFFESVPDGFLDSKPEGWGWREGDRTIPLIISRDFLDLYNYGFAVAYRLPQLTPHTVKNLRLSIELGTERFSAQITGFSDRYNSILVPETFIAWANSRFATSSSDAPARVVMRVEHLEDSGLAPFLEQKGYETNREKLKNSRLWNLLVTLACAAGGGGVIITLLAFMVTAISFQLSMTRRDSDIRLLIQLGIPPVTVWNHFFQKASLLIAGSGLIGICAAIFCVARFLAFLERFGFVVSSQISITTLLIAVLIMIVCISGSFLQIRRHVLALL